MPNLAFINQEMLQKNLWKENAFVEGSYGLARLELSLNSDVGNIFLENENPICKLNMEQACF